MVDPHDPGSAHDQDDHLVADRIEKKKQPIKKRWKRNLSDPGTRRILIATGFAFAIIGGTTYLQLMRTEEAGEVSLRGDTESFDHIAQGENLKDNPELQRQVVAADDRRIDTAIDEDGTAAVSLPTELTRNAEVIEPSAEPPVTATEEADNSPVLRSAGQSEENDDGPVTRSSSESQGGGSEPLDNVLLDRIEAQIEELNPSWDKYGSMEVLAGSYVPPAQSNGLEPFDPDGAPSGIESPDTTEPAVLARAGEMFYGVNRLGATSDLPGSPIVFDANSGVIEDHTLIGSFTSNGECIRVDLTSISGPRYTQPIEAVMVEPNSLDTCVYDLVRPRLIERYGFKLATAIIGGFASAKASAASTVVTSALGTVTEVNDSTDEGQALWSGVEALANEVQDELDTQVDEQFGTPEVVLYAQSPYAIVLLSDLLEPSASGQ